MTFKEYEKLIPKLIVRTEEQPLLDAVSLIRNYMDLSTTYVIDHDGNEVSAGISDNECEKAMKWLKELRSNILSLLTAEETATEELDRAYWDTLLLAAPHDFDSYCLYIEKDREPSKRFYQPRRKQLYPLAHALNMLENGHLELLGISLPPGIGKTTLAIFFITWTSGLHPELQSLIGSHNNEFLRGVYDECLRIFDKDGEYRWHDVFPNVGISGTNAKDLRIDLGLKKRFQTIELTSVGAGNSGKIRATNLLYCDDLCEGIEQAMSPDQMQKLWQKYTVDLRQRKQGNRVKELHIQTRWSVNDVVGRLQEIYDDNWKAQFINVPALDENGESNFNYPYGVGFTTEMYEDLRNSMDDASWRALYMGQPIEREGQLYPPDELRRYFDLPETEPDAVLAVCDSKEQGGDYCAMPIAYKYGDDYYIEDWICDNGAPDNIQIRITEKLISKGVQHVRVESNRGGTLFAKNIQDALKERGSHCKVTTKWNQTNKETRILVASAWVKEHCLFKDESAYAKANKEYRTAMQQLCGYALTAKNKHDDVPDAIADLENFAKTFEGNKLTIKARTFF